MTGDVSTGLECHFKCIILWHSGGCRGWQAEIQSVGLGNRHSGYTREACTDEASCLSKKEEYLEKGFQTV